MDGDKIIIIPEKYYMQIYQVVFWFLIIMSIICIAYGFFANEKAWLTYTIIGNVVGEVILIREWFSFGRVRWIKKAVPSNGETSVRDIDGVN